MANSSEKVIFEHPLNEKMRTWLRVEYLLRQLSENKIIENFNSAFSFFHLLNDLLDITERVDIRLDLQKELEVQMQKLSSWKDVPGIDKRVLDSLINKISTLSSQLLSSNRLGNKLKEDSTIVAVRRRIAIPGGYFNFDLPVLFMWLNLPQNKRDKYVEYWLKEFSLLEQSINIFMQLIRQSGRFQRYTCTGLFHRDNFGEFELLRIRIPSNQGIYPQISGNQTRYAIRFMHIDESKSLEKATIDFELTCC